MNWNKEYVKQFRKPFAIILVFAILITYLFPWMTSRQVGTAKAVMEFSFEGIGKGLDPKGNRFDINELKNDAILNKAIASAKMKDKISVEELRKGISISPVVSKNALGKLTAMPSGNESIKDVKEKAVYPNMYIVEYKDTGMISYLSNRKLLSHVMTEYKKFMEDKYLEDASVKVAFTKEEMLAMDYPEMVEVLQQTVENLERYASTYASSTPDFVSKKTGVGFSDLLEQSTTLRNRDVNELKSLIDFYGLTKDAQTRIKYEETMLKRAKLTTKKMEGREYTVRQIINTYSNNSNYIFASNDAGNFNLVTQENLFYNDLVEQLSEGKVSAIEARYSQQDILRAIDKLESGSGLSPSQYEERSKEVEAQSAVVMGKVDQLRKNIATLAKENYDTNIGSKMVIGKIQYEFHSFGNIIINFVILCVIAIMIQLAYGRYREKGYGALISRVTSFVKGIRAREV